MRPTAKTSGADHQVMRGLNRSLVLDLLKERSPMSRASIAKTTTLAKPTVSAIVDDLLREGLVREIGPGDTTDEGGRPPILLEFNSRSRYIVGVHLGVSRTTVVAADAMGSEIGRVQQLTPRGDPAAVLEEIASSARRVLTDAGVARKRMAAVGICVPGLVDHHNGHCFLAPNLAGWREVPVATILSEALRVPVFVHNTTQASTVAESVEGAGKGATEVVFLYAGTGIGAGVLTEGRLFHGAGGIAGEIGHCRIPGATEICNCGKTGCLETVASASAIVRSAGGLSPEEVAAAAHAGDATAVRVLTEAGQALGTAASWLINLFNPEVLVVGGGLAGAGEPLIGPLRQTALELALPQAAKRVSIRTSMLGQNAEVRGAVLLALQASGSYYRVIFQG